MPTDLHSYARMCANTHVHVCIPVSSTKCVSTSKIILTNSTMAYVHDPLKFIFIYILLIRGQTYSIAVNIFLIYVIDCLNSADICLSLFR